MNEMYNKHYVLLDTFNRVVKGWSDGIDPERDTTNAICINEKGSYQFRINGGEENPPLFDFEYMIPLYKYEGGTVIKRTVAEIEADRQIAMQPTEAEVRAQRDKLLAETDWTQVADAPIDSATRSAMRIYRQLLRDVTEQEGFPVSIVWPEMPVIVKATPEPIDEVVEAIIGVEVTE